MPFPSTLIHLTDQDERYLNAIDNLVALYADTETPINHETARILLKGFIVGEINSLLANAAVRCRQSTGIVAELLYNRQVGIAKE